LSVLHRPNLANGETSGHRHGMTDQSLECHVKEFSKNRALYVQAAARLETTLRSALAAAQAEGIVETRVKTTTSFAEKVLRKGTYSSPLDQMTDLVGGRVITTLNSEAHRLAIQVRRMFRVDERNSVDKASVLGSGEFGYLSQHLIVELDLSDLVCSGPTEVPTSLKVEIQIRTLLQHAWAAIGHDRIYKSAFQVPARWQRQAARIAASLEIADADFQELSDNLDIFRGESERQRDAQSMRLELERLGKLQQHAPDDAKLVERRARLALGLGAWQDAASMVEEFRPGKTAGLWCCLGRARKELATASNSDDEWTLAKKAFDEALVADPEHREALLGLAHHLEMAGDASASALYARVLRQDPNDPGALAGALRGLAASSSSTPDPDVWAAMTAPAIVRCESFIQAGVETVAANRWRAAFKLLDRESSDAGLFPVLEALQSCRNPSEIKSLRDELAPLRRLSAACPAFEVAWRTVTLALLAADPQPSHQGEVDQWAGPLSPIREPVWLLAGGCSKESKTAVDSIQPILEQIFQVFQGTVISGGTREGISGLVGAAMERYPGCFTSLGYLPGQFQPTESATPDPRYSDLRKRGNASHFSWSEPLFLWADLLRSGLRPSEITVLGISGGTISGFEYRLASSLGARVGVIPTTGRSAADLDVGTDFRRFPNILRLPADPSTLRLFLERRKAGLQLPTDALEELAKTVHEDYRRSVPQPSDPSHEPWETLNADLKESNRRQVLWSMDVLRISGFDVRQGCPATEILEFTESEIETLAEAEHGRWVLERLESGWRLGGPKNLATKVSPYLVPWQELEDEAREWDRQTVRKIASRLIQLGVCITRRGDSGGDRFR
jgi:ppGpp synthetase/RelA/SpoT-type nucleotidyltranferase